MMFCQELGTFPGTGEHASVREEQVRFGFGVDG